MSPRTHESTLPTRLPVTALVTVVSMTVAACATPGAGPGTPWNYTSSACVVETLGAVALCGLRSSGSGSDQVKRALVCSVAALVGCQFAKSYAASQTQTQAEVETGYKKNNGALPRDPQVTAFSTKISPSSHVKTKESLGVSSDLTVVPGRSGAPVSIEQEVAVLDKYGVEWFKGKQPANKSGEAGSYETSFDIAVPEEMEAGSYSLVQKVYLNGKAAENRLIQPVSFKVLAATNGSPTLAFAN